MRRSRRRYTVGTIALVAFTLLLGACNDAAAGRLADLPVMTTVPDGVTEVSRASGSEVGGWPTTPVMATVTYRIVRGDPDDAIGTIREVALESGWAVEPHARGESLRGSMMTADGLAQLSATISLRGDELLVTVWL